MAKATYIDPFVDFAFKRLFATDESKPILIGFLNQVLKGRKYIAAIQYGKNEHPGEINDEGGVVFDVICTDADENKFIIEVQRSYQKYFKERALFYTSRVISEQAPKGSRKDWAYNLTEVYQVVFLENFNLPDSSRSEYVQDICLANRYTGEIFYDKLGFIFIEMLNFVKKQDELVTELDKWLYALKHLTEFDIRPEYLSGPEFDQLFNLAKYANLTKGERDMYNASLKYKWDNKNVLDYAVETAEAKGITKGKQEKVVEMARKMKGFNEPVEKISVYTELSIEEIEAL
ncbi:MAG: Rpn family recombination-promoting nuclease/putative transposase [Candidatus Pedobacter colombiensis]|uniref:Rpn family recombination-promoting nuclease/putative transposase n=1 Tax=Candidatus Pedobacter colombiensis TaxID=3121371 RepID=A0AAJ5W825_9SPHI|nr:Rpn family recombination-promoting nuclease/putative transposase [Pedobacter sp.]WEK19689.1 MAG: Rpn family recombination-promoting nuclease/putative transposase [Pedobacter sp.]